MRKKTPDKPDQPIITKGTHRLLPVYYQSSTIHLTIFSKITRPSLAGVAVVGGLAGVELASLVLVLQDLHVLAGLFPLSLTYLGTLGSPRTGLLPFSFL